MNAANRIPRPPLQLILTTPEHLIAFGFGAGLARKAPGTIGTLVGLPFWFALQSLPTPLFATALLLLFAFGCWVCGESARLLGVHDYGGIVFDEIVGFIVACLPLLPVFGAAPGPDLIWLLAAFALFRLFDIWKPWPISVADRKLSGGFGIMFDDLLAGLASAAILAALISIVGRASGAAA